MSKDNDRKKLECALLHKHRAPGIVIRPPQDPLEAQVEELRRIAKKAAAGLTEAELRGAPRFPRGFVGGFAIEGEGS